MSNYDDGGPAFPTDMRQFENGTWFDQIVDGRSGMSLRDWFAGQALVGMLAHGKWPPQDIPSQAYAAADAMLAERKNVDAAKEAG